MHLLQMAESNVPVSLIDSLNTRLFTNPLSGSWDIRRSIKKKQEKSEPILLKTNENIRYGIYKAFTNFQIIEKIPKINKFFFDEKR